MGFHRIANWRVGGESTHKSASFLYILFVGRINIQILNYPESFHFIGEGPEQIRWSPMPISSSGTCLRPSTLLWDILCSSNRVTVSVYIVRVFLVHRAAKGVLALQAEKLGERKPEFLPKFARHLIFRFVWQVRGIALLWC